MDEIECSFIHYLKRVQTGYRHENDFYKFAELNDVEVVPGKMSCLFRGPPPTITIQADLYGTKQSQAIGMHEMAHHLLEQGGFEAKMLHWYGGFDEALPTIEKMCFHGGLVLQMPEPMFEKVTKRYGTSPQGILYLMDLSGAEFKEAMARWVYAQPGSYRAAFAASGNNITHAMTTGNIWLPFWINSRVPEVHIVLPEAELMSLGERIVLGTLVRYG
ncbi:hypothetical protein GCM10022631_10690 [Deinococcus rubellus]|uniref:hypothetical protein n=1 Tax=Deinococcus rubellus TaxID=1889240 RepID=UPI0031E501DA